MSLYLFYVHGTVERCFISMSTVDKQDSRPSRGGLMIIIQVRYSQTAYSERKKDRKDRKRDTNANEV